MKIPRFNEQNELSKHYLKFNLQQLINAAINVTDGAQYCIKVLKCMEGQHNKAFILTMDNGTEVCAKLPNPNAGPPGYLTASEVATRALLRDVFNIPVSQILAWSSEAAGNLVEAEYIIEEKVPGVRLGSLWNQWPRETKLKLIREVTDIEKKLTTVTFPKHGCIYFKDDLRSLIGHAEDLNMDTPASDALDCFSIGPLTSTDLWTGVRRDMKLDQRDPSEYTQSLGRNEITWIKAHATPRMNYFRSSQEHELPSDGLNLLNQYMDVAPYLIPPPTDEAASSKVLWHPDLHLDNMFVDPDTHKISCIVDWQSACIAPLFYQSGIPRMFRHSRPVREDWEVPERPENFDSLPEDGRRKVDHDLESEIIHKYYEAQVYKRAPRHWAVLQQGKVPMIWKPVGLVSGVWESRHLFFLRQSLISLAADWDGLYFSNGHQPACPIKFTDKDIELHSKEEENEAGVGQMLALFRDQKILPVDGMVDPQDYETATKNCLKIKDIFIGLAEDESEKELFTKLWPYQEGG
ncbi:hypothetical protein FQN57_000708 [Myotisia sp. PD_48]|nr:hypothetical protein FQN57_000708 [Myotisia sp. PD_48]